ncbi:MAG: BACON domain-containing protein [Prevotella sp.]|nr:BACON domain-containing protein [Prevotella sp.]
MKKKKLLILFSALLLLACGGEDGGGGTPSGGSEYLNVSNVDIPGGNTTATLAVSASPGCEWCVTWTDTWIRSISPSTGRGSQNATITISTNPSSSSERTAVVTVSNTNGSISRNVIVTQSPNTESLELSMSTMTFTNDASSQDVTVTSNTHWTVMGTASWLTLNKTEGDNNGSVRVAVEANTTESERRVVLTFKGTNGTEKQLTIIQTGRSGDFVVTPTNISAGALAGNVSFSIAAEGRWSIQSSSSWATLSDVSGEGSKTVLVSLADNMSESARTADITVSSSTKSERVTIIQSAGNKPVVSDIRESDITNIDKTKATLTFSYTSMFPVAEHGVCYSLTNSIPAKDNSTYVSQAASSKEGSPSITMTGLTAGTTYYVRAYAISAVGIQYSNTVTFATEGDWPGGDDNVTPSVQ